MPHNGTLTRAAHALHVAALGIWTGGIAMTAAAAAIIFPTVKGLAPTLPGYAAVPPEEHWLLAAGQVAARIFRVSDSVQLACGVTTLATAVLLARAHGIGRTVPARVRAVALVAAWLMLAFYLAVLAPRMQTNIEAHWRLSQAGQLAEARVHEAVFKADHPTSSRVLGGTALCTLIALVLGAGIPAQRPAARQDAA